MMMELGLEAARAHLDDLHREAAAARRVRQSRAAAEAAGHRAAPRRRGFWRVRWVLGAGA